MTGGAFNAAGQMGAANNYQQAINNLLYLYGGGGQQPAYAGPNNANINWNTQAPVRYGAF